MHTDVEGMALKVEGTAPEVEHMTVEVEVEGMALEVEGTAPEVEGMDHMAPEMVRRRGIMLGDEAKNRHRSDDVSERNHLREELVTRRSAKDR